MICRWRQVLKAIACKRQRQTMRITLTLLVAVMASTGVAVAQSATQSITLTATVPLSCKISGLSTPPADSISLGALGTAPDSTSSTTTFYPLGAGSAGFPVLCNSNTRVQVSTATDGLRNPVSFTGYDSNINYAASATLGSATSTITTNGTNAASTGTLADNSGPINGNLVVSVTPVDEHACRSLREPSPIR